MDYVSFRAELRKDAETLACLISMTDGITPERDAKLHRLLSILSNKIENPIKPRQQKRDHILSILRHGRITCTSTSASI